MSLGKDFVLIFIVDVVGAVVFCKLLKQRAGSVLLNEKRSNAIRLSSAGISIGNYSIKNQTQ